MPFGLTNGPVVFQALIDDIPRDFSYRLVLVCLDDILIFSQSLEEHTTHMCQVLTCLLDDKLFRWRNVTFMSLLFPLWVT